MPALPATPGTGHLSLELVNGQTSIVRCRSHAPLKLLTPRHSTAAAWIYANTFGGGLVAGDRIDLTVQLGAGTTAVLTTQASTKVFHEQDGRGAEQHFDITLAEDSCLLALPDPLTCFAHARFDQTQRFSLDSNSSLVLLDWLTAGRSARGENWQFTSYRNRVEITVDGREIVFDACRLEQPYLSRLQRVGVGGYQVLANVYLVGPRTQPMADDWQSWSAGLPIHAVDGLAVGFSRTPWGGVLRLAGRDTRSVTQKLMELLRPVQPWIGGCPWGRKW